jgi:hypothetical protein
MRKQSRIGESKGNFELRLEAGPQSSWARTSCESTPHNPVVVRVSLHLLLSLPQHSCSRIFDMPVKCRCNVFRISFCCAMCVDTDARYQIGPGFPKPQSSARVEVVRKCSGQDETGRRTAGMSHLAPQDLLWFF